MTNPVLPRAPRRGQPAESTEEAVEAERKAIFDRITEYIERAPVDGINAEGDFSETVSREQRKFLDGMRQARVAASSHVAARRAGVARD